MKSKGVDSMANRSEDLALDLDLFDVTKSGYVPEHKEKRKKFEAPKLVPLKTVSSEEARRQAKVSRLAALRVGVLALISFIIIGSMVYGVAKFNDKQYELQQLKNQLEAAESENVVLRVKFNSIMSKDKVEDYALTKLGMVKQESYQISYFDMAEEEPKVTERVEQKSENN